MSKEYSELTPIAEAIAELRKARAERQDLMAMLADPEMKDLAEAELEALDRRLPELERGIQILLLPKDEADEKNAILEVRAGTGGEEAALFAAELFQMYQRYAALRGWRFETMDVSETGIGGYKEATASITGRSVFARLKYESGVHRVQRVPATEAGGRIHTSAATVAVLPEAEEVEIQVRDEDLRIDTMRAGGAGGQHVNKTESAVRITHIPTGTVVTCMDEKSQHKNKARALRILRSRLFVHLQEIQRQKTAARTAPKKDIDFGSQIRSYVLQPYTMANDHRTETKIPDVHRVLDGDIDPFIDAWLKAQQPSKEPA